MADKTPKQAGNVKTYFSIILAILVLLILLFLVNSVASFFVPAFFPSYTAYVSYIAQFSWIVIGFLASYVVYKIALSLTNRYSQKRRDPTTGEILKIVLRILFFFVVISIVLSTLGISLSTALAGGAVGGVILGLAIQTILTSILSGVLVSSSNALLPGDVLVLQSPTWGTIICRVNTVRTIFTEVTAISGNKIKLPNTVLFSSTVFTKLWTGDSYTYLLPVIVNGDVPMKSFEKRVKVILEKYCKSMHIKTPEIYFISKNGSTNTFNVILNFNTFEQINKLVDCVNNAFDETYNGLKK